MSGYEVIVGNIGTVARDVSEKEGVDLFGHYVWHSRNGVGRAQGEDVTLMLDGEPVMEHFGTFEGEE